MALTNYKKTQGRPARQIALCVVIAAALLRLWLGGGIL